MEIVVVDNCSDQSDPESLVRSIGQGRVRFHRNERNVGGRENFNQAIRLARGVWVHLLHDDDWVLDGFYSEFERITRAERVAAVGFRCRLVDGEGQVLGETVDLSGGEPPQRAREEFLRGCPVQFAGVLVQRAAYEELGGFLSEFSYLTDVEMWSRVFFQRPCVFSPKALAVYRVHATSDSVLSGATGTDCEQYYRLAPLLQRNMRLSSAEMRRYRRTCHRAVKDRCRLLAEAGNGRAWARGQWLYAQRVRDPKEVADYVLRFFPSLWRYVRAVMRRPRRSATSIRNQGGRTLHPSG
jgi:GT2 family glycosyltransferase